MHANQAQNEYQGCIYYAKGSLALGLMLAPLGLFELFGVSVQQDKLLISIGVLFALALLISFYFFRQASKYLGSISLLRLNLVDDEYLDRAMQQSFQWAMLGGMVLMIVLVLFESANMITGEQVLKRGFQSLIGTAALIHGAVTLFMLRDSE